MAKGQIHLARIHALQAYISTGDVSIGHIAGLATIEGGVAAVRIEEVTGVLKLSNSGGQTWIGHAATDVDLSSANGGFDIDRADGSVTAKTANGAIRTGRLTHGHTDLSNSSGNIHVRVSVRTAAWVDADSTRGKVRNSIPTQENTDTFDYEVRIHARTRHGDIVIQRDAS